MVKVYTFLSADIAHQLRFTLFPFAHAPPDFELPVHFTAKQLVLDCNQAPDFLLYILVVYPSLCAVTRAGIARPSKIGSGLHSSGGARESSLSHLMGVHKGSWWFAVACAAGHGRHWHPIIESERLGACGCAALRAYRVSQGRGRIKRVGDASQRC
jgi:hypothetical protein